MHMHPSNAINSKAFVPMCSKCPLQSLTETSRQGTLHSLVPRRLLSQPNPIPVHSVLGIFRPSASIATPARAEAVSLTVFVKNDASPLHVCILSDPVACGSGFGNGDEKWRGSNQLALRSKKQLSDQWHEEANKIRSRMVQ